MASLRKRGRVWYYRVVDADGVQHERKGCPDRRATEAMAALEETDAAKVRSGLIDPKALRVAAQGRRPVQEHLDEFIAAMAHAGRNAQHVAQTRTYITRLATLAGVGRLAAL